MMARSPGNSRSDDRSHPEEPQLPRCSVAVEERHPGRASRVDRSVVDRDRDEVNQGQTQPDGDRGESFGRTSVRSPENDVEEEAGQQNLGDQGRDETVPPGEW